MLLLEDVVFCVNELLLRFVPDLSFIFVCWNLYSDELAEGLSSLIMSNYNEFHGLLIVENWAVNNCVI